MRRIRSDCMNSQITAWFKPKFALHMLISLALVMACAEAIGKPEVPRDALVSMDGFNFRINRVAWLSNQMDHSKKYPMPSSMMPDMPAHGIRRLSLDITLHNEGQNRQRFQAQEVQLTIDNEKSIAASSTTFGELFLNTGQLVHLVLQFDMVPEAKQKLRLIWQRAGQAKDLMAIPQPPKDQMFHDSVHDHH